MTQVIRNHETTGSFESQNPPLVFSAVEFRKPIPVEEKFRSDQDRGFVTPDGKQAIVADGMGDQSGGLAAQLICQTVHEQLLATDFDGKTEKQVQSLLSHSIHRAQRRMMRAVDSFHLSEDAGATLAGVIQFTNKAGRNRAAIIGIGDAFVQRVRAGKVERLTVEETMAGLLFPHIGVFNEQFAQHLGKKVFSSHHEEVKIEDHNITFVDVEEGDRFIIGTDGIEELYTDPANYPDIPESYHALMSKPKEKIVDHLKKMASRPTKSPGGFTKPDDRLVFIIDVEGANMEGPAKRLWRQHVAQGGWGISDTKPSLDKVNSAKPGKNQADELAVADVPNGKFQDKPYETPSSSSERAEKAWQIARKAGVLGKKVVLEGMKYVPKDTVQRVQEQAGSYKAAATQELGNLKAQSEKAGTFYKRHEKEIIAGAAIIGAVALRTAIKRSRNR